MAAIWAESLYRLRSKGWQCLLGSALPLLSLVLFVFVLLPKNHRLEQLKKQLVVQEAGPARNSHPIDQSPQAVLDAFYKLLPREEQAPKTFQQILLMASDEGIKPEKSEYQAIRNVSAAFTRYQMTLPIRGRYVDIRQFITHVLNTLPNVALSEISFKRDEADSVQVEARVRFSIYIAREVL